MHGHTSFQAVFPPTRRRTAVKIRWIVPVLASSCGTLSASKAFGPATCVSASQTAWRALGERATAGDNKEREWPGQRDSFGSTRARELDQGRGQGRIHGPCDRTSEPRVAGSIPARRTMPNQASAVDSPRAPRSSERSQHQPPPAAVAPPVGRVKLTQSVVIGRWPPREPQAQRHNSRVSHNLRRGQRGLEDSCRGGTTPHRAPPRPHADVPLLPNSLGGCRFGRAPFD